MTDFSDFREQIERYLDCTSDEDQLYPSLSVRLVDFLNELLEIDREAIWDLFSSACYSPCNEPLAEHPTVQVTQESQVGFIGILNGFLGQLGERRICTIRDTDRPAEIIKFAVFEEWL